MSEESLRNTPLVKWMEFLDAKLPDGSSISASVAATLMLQFTGTQPTGPSTVILRRATEALGVVVCRDSQLGSGVGRIALTQDLEGLWPEAAFVIRLGDASPARKRFLNAHEVAHAVLYSLLCHPHIRMESKRPYANELEREQFCNEFSRHLVLAPARVAEITFEQAQTRLGTRDREWVESLWRQHGPRLTFQHLRVLAGVHGISIRCLISILHRHELLRIAECGIAVMRVGPNRVTGKEVGLRIWQRACPPWGYIATNQRAERQGFACATDVLKTERDQHTSLREESLVVKLADARPEHPGPKWHQVPLVTRVAYTPVDVKGEGRYLVAVWPWPATGPNR